MGEEPENEAKADEGEEGSRAEETKEEEAETADKKKEKKEKKSDKVPDEGIFTAKEMEGLEKKLAEVEKWRDEKVAEQEAMVLSEMPKLTVSSIKSKIQDLDGEVQLLIGKARMIRAERERAKRKAEEEKKKEEEKAKKEKKKKKKEKKEEAETAEKKDEKKEKKSDKVPDEGIFTAKEMEGLEKKLAEVEKWRDEKVAEQEAMVLSEMPKLTVSSIKS